MLNLQACKNLLGRRFQKIPIEARGVYRSLIYTLDDDPSKPSNRLITLFGQALQAAADIHLESLGRPGNPDGDYFNIWPGEHYRLLAGLVSQLKPTTIVEIGTFTGLSFLALREKAPSDSELVTFDVVPWNRIAEMCLQDNDWLSPLRRQEVGDLGCRKFFDLHAELFARADLIFVDGPKDITFETALMRNFESLRFTKTPIVIFDDIKLWQMLSFWRGVKRPKLDVTSLGHWTGTGMIDWCG